MPTCAVPTCTVLNKFQDKILVVFDDVEVGE